MLPGRIHCWLLKSVLVEDVAVGDVEHVGLVIEPSWDEAGSIHFDYSSINCLFDHF